MRRFLCLLLVLLCLPCAIRAEDATVYPPETYEFSKHVSASHESDTLIYSIESFSLDTVPCLLTKIWVRDPARQIRKVNAPWGEGLANPLKLAE